MCFFCVVVSTSCSHKGVDYYEDDIDVFLTSEGRLRWSAGMVFDNWLVYERKYNNGFREQLKFSCYTCVIGKMDSYITFSHIAGPGCYYDSKDLLRSNILPQIYPTYYLLDFTKGKDTLIGPLTLVPFKEKCGQMGVPFKLWDEAGREPLPKRSMDD